MRPRSRPHLSAFRSFSLGIVAALVAASAQAAGRADEAALAQARDPVRACDRLAAWRPDPARQASAVPAERFQADAARRACIQAVSRAPDLPRLRFQLARAYRALGEAALSYALLEQSAQGGSAAAYLALGRLFQDGDHVRRDHMVALLHYLEAARLGAPAGLEAAWLIWSDPDSPARSPERAAAARGAGASAQGGGDLAALRAW